MSLHTLPVEKSTHAPLQTELNTLNKIIDSDILEISARLLDSTNNAKLETNLTDSLLEKCEDFETVCQHIEFVLKQSKQILESQPNPEKHNYMQEYTEEPMDVVQEEDTEELLQIQKDRLDRLRNVILLGMDAEKAASNLDNKEDLLF